MVKGDPLAEVHLKGLEPLGVPKGLAGTNLIFHYNNIGEFKELIAKNRGQIAAIIMEPIRNDYPENDFLREIREITQKENIVLVFDEITAGFRLCCGGSHLVLGINPDIAVFAKAMTNGYPVSAIIGKKQMMLSAQDTFISSTFWTERIALAAALKSIECFQKEKVEIHLERIGKKVQDGWKEIADKYQVKIYISGIYPLSHFEFLYQNPLAYKTYFTQEMLKHGFLASTGFYVSYAHTSDIVEQYLTACEKVFARISDISLKGGNIVEHLEGKICHSGFERLN